MAEKAKITVKLKKQHNAQDLPLPQYMSENSAGMDLYANIHDSVILEPMQRKLISTGISLSLPPEFEAQVRARSGLALKKGITVLNSPGTIDSDYRGVVSVILINLGTEPVQINRGDRIAQLVVNRYEKIVFKVVEDLDETERGEGGFGHTGVEIASESVHPSKIAVTKPEVKEESLKIKSPLMDNAPEKTIETELPVILKHPSLKEIPEKKESVFGMPGKRLNASWDTPQKAPVITLSKTRSLAQELSEKALLKAASPKDENEELEELLQGMKKLDPDQIEKEKAKKKTNIKEKRLIEKIIKLDNCYDENIKKIDKMFGIEIL